MTDGSPGMLPDATETDGVSLTVLALAVLAVGYAGGSVLAGEPVGEQAWLVPALASVLGAWIALSANETRT